MYERILQQIRDKIRTRRYVMTIHAEEEMDDDNLSIFDVESIVLSGKIHERQKDTETAEWKYLITGETLAGEKATVVGKLGVTEKLVIITVYRGQ